MNLSDGDIPKIQAEMDEEIEAQRAGITDAYVQQLKSTFRLNDLPACIDDAIVYLVYMIKDIGCPPQKITVLAEKDEFDAIWAGVQMQIANVKSVDEA